MKFSRQLSISLLAGLILSLGGIGAITAMFLMSKRRAIGELRE